MVPGEGQGTRSLRAGEAGRVRRQMPEGTERVVVPAGRVPLKMVRPSGVASRAEEAAGRVMMTRPGAVATDAPSAVAVRMEE